MIDLDIAKFFDSVRWDLIIKAVQANTDQPWVVLYVERWLAAPLVLPDGPCNSETAEPRRAGASVDVGLPRPDPHRGLGQVEDLAT